MRSPRWTAACVVNDSISALRIGWLLPSQDRLDPPGLGGGIGVAVARETCRQVVLQPHVLVAQLRVAAQHIAEEQITPPLIGLGADKVEVVGPEILGTLRQHHAARVTEVAAIAIPSLDQDCPCCFQLRAASKPERDIDDRLGSQPSDCGAADVFDGIHETPKQVCERLPLVLERGPPARIPVVQNNVAAAKTDGRSPSARQDSHVVYRKCPLARYGAGSPNPRTAR
jgi:hypothetical protein